MKRLEGKVALVTGASQGIGAAIAQLFIQEGAQLIVSDHKDQKVYEVAQKLGCSFFHIDVSQEEDWRQAIAYVESTYGRLDILVNNAGITGLSTNTGPQDPEHCSLQAWRMVHAINLDGVFLGCKYALPLMQKHGGSIINMSSRSGLVGTPYTAAYASSKAAIINHSRTVALYCAQKKYNIRCNALCPAVIDTALWNEVLGSSCQQQQQGKEKLAEGVPLGRMGTVCDVAYAALYLASDESAYVTGTYMVIDGGLLAGSKSALEPILY